MSGPKNFFTDSDGFGVLDHGEDDGETFRLIGQLQVDETEHGSGPGWGRVGSVYGEIFFQSPKKFFLGGNTGKSPVSENGLGQQLF